MSLPATEILKKRLSINNAIIRKLDDKELKTVGYFGYDEKEARIRIFIGEGVTGLCAKEKREIIINDLRNYNGRYIAGINNAESELCIPIMKDKELIGTLNIESTEKNNFSRDKVDIAIRIAAMLSHSLLNPENKTGRNLARALAYLENSK